MPVLDLFVQASAPLLVLNGLVFHDIYFEFFESDILPDFSLLVPLVLDLPNVGKLIDFFLDELNFWVAHWFDIEDF